MSNNNEDLAQKERNRQNLVMLGFTAMTVSFSAAIGHMLTQSVTATLVAAGLGAFIVETIGSYKSEVV